jgi:hypothetical protein
MFDQAQLEPARKQPRPAWDLGTTTTWSRTFRRSGFLPNSHFRNEGSAPILLVCLYIAYDIWKIRCRWTERGYTKMNLTGVERRGQLNSYNSSGGNELRHFRSDFARHKLEVSASPATGSHCRVRVTSRREPMETKRRLTPYRIKCCKARCHPGVESAESFVWRVPWQRTRGHFYF